MFRCGRQHYRCPGCLGLLLSSFSSGMSRKGISNWLLQRVSAIVLAAFFSFNIGFIVANPDLDYFLWSKLYSSGWMQIFSLLAVLALASHAWIGLWCVYTDYVTERLLGPKATFLRNSLQLLTVLIIGSYVAWTLSIFWNL